MYSKLSIKGTQDNRGLFYIDNRDILNKRGAISYFNKQYNTS